MTSASSQASIQFEGLTVEHSNNSRVNGVPWSKVVDKQDLVTVTMMDEGGRREVDFFGFLDDKPEQRGHSAGIPDDKTVLQCRGLGAALEDYSLFWHSHLKGHNNLGGIGFLARSKGRAPSGRPDQVVKQLFDTFINDRFLFALADGRKLNEAVSLQLKAATDGFAQVALSAMGTTSRLYETLLQYCDSPWNELFVEFDRQAQSGKKKAALVMRPTPFTFDRWQELASPGSGYRFDYDPQDLDGFERLQSPSSQVYNFFWCAGKALFGSFDQLSTVYEQTSGRAPIYLKDSIRKHGLRKLEQSTEYIQFVGKSPALTPADQRNYNTRSLTVTDMIAYKTELLFQWFGFPDFLQGSIPLTGRVGRSQKGGIRLGSVLHRTSDGLQSYIIGYDQSWSMEGSWTTTVHTQRGHHPQEYREWWNRESARLPGKGKRLDVPTTGGVA